MGTHVEGPKGLFKKEVIFDIRKENDSSKTMRNNNNNTRMRMCGTEPRCNTTDQQSRPCEDELWSREWLKNVLFSAAFAVLFALNIVCTARVSFQCPRCAFHTFSTAHAYLTFPLTEMNCHARLCDRLRLYGNVSSFDRLRFLAIFYYYYYYCFIIINVITSDISTYLLTLFCFVIYLKLFTVNYFIRFV